MTEILHLCFENPWKPRATGGALEMRRRIEAEAGAFPVRAWSVDFAGCLAPAPPRPGLSEHREFARSALPSPAALARYPLPVARRLQPRLRRDLEGLPFPDLVVVEGFQMAWVLDLPWARAAARNGTRLAVRVHDIESEYHQGLAAGSRGARRLAHAWVGRQYRRLERRCLGLDVDLHHISPVECRVLQAEGGRARHTWVPPVAASWSPPPTASDSTASASGGPGALRYFGDLSIPANLDGLQRFLDFDWPTVRAAVPGARLFVAGKSSEGVAGAGVQGVGFVPDLGAWLEGSAGLVVPNRNPGGIKVKLLDCLASGIPVVASQEMWADAVALGVAPPWPSPPPMAQQATECLASVHREAFGRIAAEVRRRFSAEAHVARMRAALGGGAGPQPL